MNHCIIPLIDSRRNTLQTAVGDLIMGNGQCIHRENALKFHRRRRRRRGRISGRGSPTMMQPICDGSGANVQSQLTRRGLEMQ